MAQPPTGNTAVDVVLAFDLPHLPDARRSEAVTFVVHRFATLPHHMKLGVSVLDRIMNVSVRVLGSSRFAATSRTRIPLLAEYFRLVRSLGYAFVWETWPDTAHDGRPLR
jgi:hypothetical protein